MPFDKVFSDDPRTIDTVAPGSHQAPSLGIDIAANVLYTSSGDGWEPVQTPAIATGNLSIEGHASVGSAALTNPDFGVLYPNITNFAYDTPATTLSVIENNSKATTQTEVVAIQKYTPTTTVAPGSGNQAAVIYNEVNMDGQTAADFVAYGATTAAANISNTRTVDTVNGSIIAAANFGTGNVTHLFGLSASAQNNGTGTVSNDAIGVLGQVWQNGGTINAAYSFWAENFTSAGHINGWDGFFVPDPFTSGTGTIGTVRGLHLQINNGVAGVTTAYSLDSTGTATSRFAGPVSLPYTQAFTVYSAAGTPLPSAATAGVGARAFVSDATVATFGSAYASGGTNKVPVYSDGSAWHIG